MKLAVFPGRRGPPSEADTLLAAYLAAAESGSAEDRRKAGRVRRAAERKRRGDFMRVWFEREAEIREALSERAASRRAERKRVEVSVMLVIDVLRNASYSLGFKSQRMGVTQAELAKQLGLSAGQISAAFTELAAVGAVLRKEHSGRSVTWEVDADYCSAMPEPERLKVLAEQDQWREAARREELARTAQGSFRLVDRGPL